MTERFTMISTLLILKIIFYIACACALIYSVYALLPLSVIRETLCQAKSDILMADSGLTHLVLDILETQPVTNDFQAIGNDISINLPNTKPGTVFLSLDLIYGVFIQISYYKPVTKELDYQVIVFPRVYRRVIKKAFKSYKTKLNKLSYQYKLDKKENDVQKIKENFQQIVKKAG